MSMIPMGGSKPSPNPWLAENYPASLLTMGLTAERVARHYKVSREDQDAFALASHQKALGGAGRRGVRGRAGSRDRHHRHAGSQGRQAAGRGSGVCGGRGAARRHISRRRWPG